MPGQHSAKFAPQAVVKRIEMRKVACQGPDGDVAVDLKQADAEWSHLKLQILAVSTEEAHIGGGETSTYQKTMRDPGHAMIKPKIIIGDGDALDMTVGEHNGKPVMECVFPVAGQTFPIMATLTTKYTSQVNKLEVEISGHKFKITNPELVAAGCCVIG